MPRTGGESDKLGNRYESLWTVHNLMDVLAGEAVALEPESFQESTGIEFIKTLQDSTQEFHSVKRQRAVNGWTLYALTGLGENGRSVLKDLFDKLDDKISSAVVFVSATIHSQAYELWDRAQRCHTPEEFEHQLTSDKGLHEDFNKYILPLCDNDLANALKRFRALRFEPIGEHVLRRHIETNARRLLYRIDGNLVNGTEVVLKLADFIYDSLGRRLVEADVRSELERHGYYLQDWARDSHVVGQVGNLNSRYLRHVEGDMVLGRSIPRDDAAIVARALQEKEGELAQLVVGVAGLGKSCVLAQTIRHLESAGIPLLALRLDNIPVVNSTRALGNIVDLPDSPAIVLAGISQGRRAVMLIDQLDAMSVVSGRNAEQWQIFEDLLHEVKQHPNLRLLLACRAFDLEHDPRLAGLAKSEGLAHRINLQPLPVDTVKKSVREGGGNPEQMTARELEILRTPFHLHLFLQGEPANPIPFGGRQELFDRYWKEKRRKANSQGVDFERVVGVLTDALSQNESISAPVNRLDAVASDAEFLASEHVLLNENERYRFFHESFFDYAFARRFVREGRDLVHFLTSECGEQHLFRRAQVRQVLAYQREDDRQTYLTTLASLLNHSSIRVHLKKLILDWLSQIDDPSIEEWSIVEPLLKHPQFKWAAFQILWGKLPWFDLLYNNGVLERLLSDDDDAFVDHFLRALSLEDFLKNRSVQIANMLRDHRGKGEIWLARFRGIFHSGQIYHSREIFDLVMELVDEGLFDNSDELRWHSLLEMVEPHPDYAISLLEAVLRRRIIQAKNHGEPNPFNIEQRDRQIEAQFIITTQRKTPILFAEEIVPIVKEIVLANAESALCGGFYDNVWFHISYGPEHDTAQALLGSSGRSLHELARIAPEKCEDLLVGWQELEHKTLRFLLVCAWSGNLSYFAETAANFFINHPLGFSAGYDIGIGEAARLGDAMSLLKQISPLISQEAHVRLETAIVGRTSPFEKEPKYRGHNELTLLQLLHPERLGAQTKSRLGELERKFPEESSGHSHQNRASRRKVSFVSLGIPQIAYLKMTDDQLIKLLRQYSSTERRRPYERSGRPAHDLYSGLMCAAKYDRERFARLTLELPDDIHPIHFDAILWGLVDNSQEVVKGGSDGNTDITVPNTPLLAASRLLDVVQRVHSLPGKPCGRAICRVADAVAKNAVPVELIEIVADYAVNDGDPQNEVWEGNAGSGGKYYGGDPFTAGINSARGSAADSFTKFLFAHREMAERLLPYVEALAKDKSIAVRAVNIEALLALLNTHRDKSVELFIETCESHEVLWATRSVKNYLYYATFTHYSTLRPLLCKMLEAKNKTARHTAARQIILAAFRHPKAEADLQKVFDGDEECRTGAAEIYAHNVHDVSVRGQCLKHLERLFNDPAKQVRDMAGRWFHGRNGSWADWQASLLAKYVESVAFVDGSYVCYLNLNETPAKLPVESLRLIERAVDLFEQELEKPSSELYRFSYHTPRLTLRLYEQFTDEPTRRRCLNLLDRMISFGWGEASQELAKADRW